MVVFFGGGLGGLVGVGGGGGNVIVKRPALSLCAIEIGATRIHYYYYSKLCTEDLSVCLYGTVHDHL